MKRWLYFLLALCSLGDVYGQFTSYFSSLTPASCPTDPATTVIWPSEWTIYQTTNDNWDGPPDSVCISAAPYVQGFGINIDLGQIDPDKPLFLRAKASALIDIPFFEPDRVYVLTANAELPGAVALLKTGTDCNQDLCSGAFVGIGVPGDIRFHTGQFLFESSSDISINACFPTEYFLTQTLDEVVLKFVFQPGINLDGLDLTVYSIQIEPHWSEPGLITEVVATPADYNAATQTYDVPLEQASSDPWAFGVYLLKYDEPTFPSVAEPSYVEATVTPNTPDPQVINLVVQPWQILEIQPFTYLIGGLVEGSDSVRHQANLVNNGGDLCFNFIDLVFAGGSEYRHRAGTLDMNNAFSCMKFMGGSALRVHEGGTLHYGNDGTGMLALCTGSTLALERDATLLIDGVMTLYECNPDAPPAQLYMDLPPGARLAFTENARLTNRFSHGQQMRLNVRMLGGTIDDAALRPEDRAVINRLYPEPPADLAENVRVFPVPVVGSYCTVAYTAAAGEQVLLRWTDVQGKWLGEEIRDAERGVNEWQCATPRTPGVYFLSVRSSDGRTVTRRIVI